MVLTQSKWLKSSLRVSFHLSFLWFRASLGIDDKALLQKLYRFYTKIYIEFTIIKYG